ncbi:hypothetical protein T265_12156 [Opisthorchis viverrini]|uniref:Uncharacterized protein n=1 Tax=Opisthorchis viverrini TaxID=6198 RepID=A0A074YVT6_OPIVI|nr:hypothetical protein T265_12156 [Opisthorchis viverrini]KER18783.1 hypothetical protein T265_12156 [Opisthorchis viverrini]
MRRDFRSRGAEILDDTYDSDTSNLPGDPRKTSIFLMVVDQSETINFLQRELRCPENSHLDS